MRWHILRRVLLPQLVILLSLCFSCGSHALLEHRCGLGVVGWRNRSAPLAVVREVPRRGQGAWQAYTTASPGDWAPIRIHVSVEDLHDPLKYCVSPGMHRPDFEGGTHECTSEDVLTDEKKSILLESSIPNAVKLHSERLLVRPVNEFLSVPQYQMGDVCYPFKIPAEHRNPGIYGYDTVIYAAAGPSPHAGVVAWATWCSRLREGRPVVGAMNLSPSRISKSSWMVRTVAHEIAHALGFDPVVFSERRMMTTAATVRGKRSIPMLTSLMSIVKARKHYNCSSSAGIELEDEGGNGTAAFHLERRNAKDELMAGVVTSGYYSALSMAIFDDMMFYKANFSMAEPMSWGSNFGCSLLTDACVKNGVNNYPGMFCNNTQSNLLKCTSDRLFLGRCYVMQHKVLLPPPYRYFRDPRRGGPGGRLMDLCPFVDSESNKFRCSALAEDASGSSLGGPESLCLTGDSLTKDGVPVGDVCAEVRCGDGGDVHVRYRGDDAWYPCPEGESLTPRRTFDGGRIVCPKYDEACIIAPDGSSRVSARRASKGNLVGSTNATDPAQKSNAGNATLPSVSSGEDTGLTVIGPDSSRDGREGSVAGAVFTVLLFLFIALSPVWESRHIRCPV